ncbi:UNKNOWN [Stylonychia lemnae]|uniref:Uncharacterized protein n=1 Tax=Stylonychia lemnae TaxID=5949 RepID=A0A078AKY4_STYLE|nr:UNKNOWN [Stylonychia lemnae]|eukprot:CDW82859.1 UNKNOWN [Stylonychia lemnae]
MEIFTMGRCSWILALTICRKLVYTFDQIKESKFPELKQTKHLMSKYHRMTIIQLICLQNIQIQVQKLIQQAYYDFNKSQVEVNFQAQYSQNGTGFIKFTQTQDNSINLTTEMENTIAFSEIDQNSIAQIFPTLKDFDAQFSFCLSVIIPQELQFISNTKLDKKSSPGRKDEILKMANDALRDFNLDLKNFKDLKIIQYKYTPYMNPNQKQEDIIGSKGLDIQILRLYYIDQLQLLNKSEKFYKYLKQLELFTGKQIFHKAFDEFLEDAFVSKVETQDLIFKLNDYLIQANQMKSFSGLDIFEWSNHWSDNGFYPNIIEPDILYDNEDGLMIESFEIYQFRSDENTSNSLLCQKFDIAQFNDHYRLIDLNDYEIGSCQSYQTVDHYYAGIIGAVIIDHNDVTYAKVRLDDKTIQNLRHNLQRIDQVKIRFLFWQNLWQMLVDHQVSSQEFVEIAQEQMIFEHNHFLLKLILGLIKDAINFHIDQDLREYFTKQQVQQMLILIESELLDNSLRSIFLTRFPNFISAYNDSCVQLVQWLRDGSIDVKIDDEYVTNCSSQHQQPSMKYQLKTNEKKVLLRKVFSVQTPNPEVDLQFKIDLFNEAFKDLKDLEVIKEFKDECVILLSSFENKLKVMSCLIGQAPVFNDQNVRRNIEAMKHFYESLDVTRSSYFHERFIEALDLVRQSSPAYYQKAYCRYLLDRRSKYSKILDQSWIYENLNQLY